MPVRDVPGGSAEMDEFLRADMKLRPNEQIWAAIAYVHPEEHSGNMKQMAEDYVKTESGNTHLGMYVGNGVTANSPETYHSRQWKVQAGSLGYPATVQIIEFKGVKQETFNRNAYITTVLLNNGVQFPSDYKKDMYRTINLKITLQFYRDWLKGESYLRNDDTWKTYCAEHVTIITNCALNIPQNLKSYQEIWGDAEGSKLYELAREQFLAKVGQAKMDEVWGNGIKFRPLWQRRGVTNPVEESTFGKALAWPAQTNSDIMVNFLESYASWPQVGAHVSAAVAFGFKDTLTKRMSSTTEGSEHIGKNFDQLVGKAVVLMFVSEAMTVPNVNPESYFKTKRIHFYAAMGGNPADIQESDPRWALTGLIMKAIEPFHAKIKSTRTLKKQQAYSFFRKELIPILEAARQVAIVESDRENSSEKLVRFNSPPAVTHRVASGVHASDEDVTIREVATAMVAEHLRKKTAQELEKHSRRENESPRLRPTRRNCRETPDELECLSYRQLQRRCMNAKREGLNIACNGRKSAMLAALKELGVRN